MVSQINSRRYSLPVNAPRDYDIIKGRGNGANMHPGNISFRKLVSSHKDAYYVSSNDEKKKIVHHIIRLVQTGNPHRRFLCEDTGVWRLMDQKSILRKVGQALREQQARFKDVEQTGQITRKITIDKLPRVINIAPPADHRRVLLDQKSKQGRDDFFCNILNAHTFPGIEKHTHKTQTQQYQIGLVKKEVTLLREQVSVLSKRAAFLEQNMNDEVKKSIEKNRNLSYAATRSLLSPQKYPLNGQQSDSKQSMLNLTSYQGNISTNSTAGPNKSLCKKTSLHDFSQALVSSIRGISKLNYAEDILFTLLANSKQPEESQI